MTAIIDPLTGNAARVGTNNRLKTQAISETAGIHANDEGDAYNINTGLITITNGESAVLYLKNNETRPLVIQALAVGQKVATATDLTDITIVKNPTAGTLVSGAAAVDINQNRNFGSSKTLDVTAYKGADGNTLTDGDDIIILVSGVNGRLYAGIDLEIPQGTTIGVKLNPTISTNLEVYAAFICYLHAEES